MRPEAIEILRRLVMTPLGILVLSIALALAAGIAAKRQRAMLALGGPRQPAGFWIRVAALYCDSLLLNTALGAVLVGAAVLDCLRWDAARVWGAGIAACLLVFLCYYTVGTARRGRTWGKRLAGLEVVTFSGARPGWGRAICRSLASLILLLGSFLLLALVLVEGVLLVLVRRHRALHDYAAGTTVRATAPPSRALPYLTALGLWCPVILFFCVFRPFVAQTFPVVSRGTPAMSPTVAAGDRLLVNTLVYRVTPVRRGDIVAFERNPELQDRPGGPTVVCIRRVIALPGDAVCIRRLDGVYVNGQRIADPPGAPLPEYDWPPEEVRRSPIPRRLSSGHYFVLGDRRNDTCDSHLCRDDQTTELGVATTSILGKVSLCYWPPDRLRGLH